MKGNDKTLLQQIDEKDRDIAAPYEGLGMASNHIGIQIADDSLGSIATPRAEDGLNLRIEEHLHQLPGALLIRSSQIEMFPLQERG